ncbi:energy-coupling factor transporter transmembrane protein EcfT [Fructobacillus sp. M1-13]|uniref:Cobalt ABC transporter permease n=1 Tax=Fructobacillus papyriferae TaxID=2713171 RepID=A0ABS5QNG7_9LACO|nr:energy-coupling factor transporter transmembrane component T [Fructobacillus papyriferae]MBS9334663.1 cobalt ABC transporter permease [Fructobacillus papyriferae]MCD2158653.1 energy-coupling factor transporter transmembrane protein EcfT [Fructobacillus papyriferae]
MMNASQRLFLTLLLSFEIVLTQSLSFNALLLLFFNGLVLSQGLPMKRYLYCWAVGLIPAIGSFWSFYLYAQGDLSHRLHVGLVMGSRVFLLIFVGAWLANKTKEAVLLQSLQQNLHLSNTFIYGLLSALNVMPRFKQAFKKIQAASQMRGVSLHWYQPTLYFKALIQAIQWSESLAMAMTAHGFQEGAVRSVYQTYPYKKVGFAWLALVFILTIGLLWLLPY